MDRKKSHKSFLKIKAGVEPPPSLNKHAIKKIRSATNAETRDYVKAIISGNITVLSRAITLAESTLPRHSDLSHQILEQCLPYSGKSIRIGITGVPGVGKSTFIEALGNLITSKDHKLAVLAIDPSSRKSKGSILGDKTRMEHLANNPAAYIRPSPTAGTLGGVARKTREAIILCEAAGFDVIVVETVGVGQSEDLVHSMVDYFILLMLAGAGDELQGIKRGIMEMADAIVINKADNDNISKANSAKAEYRHALHLFPMPESGWKPTIQTCSSITGEGIAKVWDNLLKYQEFTLKNGYFQRNRNRQVKERMYEYILGELQQKFYQNDTVKKLLPKLEKEIASNTITSYAAAKCLLDGYFSNIKK